MLFKLLKLEVVLSILALILNNYLAKKEKGKEEIRPYYKTLFSYGLLLEILGLLIKEKPNSKALHRTLKIGIILHRLIPKPLANYFTRKLRKIEFFDGLMKKLNR